MFQIVLRQSPEAATATSASWWRTRLLLWALADIRLSPPPSSGRLYFGGGRNGRGGHHLLYPLRSKGVKLLASRSDTQCAGAALPDNPCAVKGSNCCQQKRHAVRGSSQTWRLWRPKRMRPPVWRRDDAGDQRDFRGAKLREAPNYILPIHWNLLV